METEPDLILQLFASLIPLLTLPPVEVVLGLLGIVVLLAGSALISGSEVAFFSLTPNDFEKLEQENTISSKRILYLKDFPRRLLATILISNNFINIGIVILSDFVLNKILPPGTFESWVAYLLRHSWSQPIIAFLGIENWIQEGGMSRLINFLITVVGVTFLLVLFGEVAPKVYAKLNNIRLAKFMASPLYILSIVFGRVNSVLVGWTTVIENRLERAPVNQQTSKEDIDEAIDLTVNQEADTVQEVDILKSIVKFGDVSVKQIMRSRVDVVAVDFRIPYLDLLKVVRQSGYSRIPVYDDDFDNITGILYVKDLIGFFNEPENFEWQQLIRTDVLYVPEAKKIDDLLKEFQRKHLHMAIVVDEYGGSSGIATLEDILEEIIGEIKDEFDDEAEVVYRKIDDQNYLFEGKTLLNDVCRILGLDTTTFDEIKGEADSLAGLLLEMLGQIPKVEVEVEHENFTFKIVSVSKRRIEQILVTIKNKKVQ